MIETSKNPLTPSCISKGVKNLKNKAVIKTAVKISTNGYKIEIDFLQFLHLPRKIIQDKTGILSNQAITLLHLGHEERFFKNGISVMLLTATTFRNDPQQRKIRNIIKVEKNMIIPPPAQLLANHGYESIQQQCYLFPL